MTDLIQAASIARVSRKSDGKFLGFLVKSDSSDQYYEVTCLKVDGHCAFFCTCKGFTFHGHCKHCDACKELCAARKALAKAAAVTEQAQDAQDARVLQALIAHPSHVFQTTSIAETTGLTTKDVLASIRRLQTAGQNIQHAGWTGAYLFRPTEEQLAERRKAHGLKAKEATIKRAPQFANRGFVMAPVAELGGRWVPLAS